MDFQEWVMVKPFSHTYGIISFKRQNFAVKIKIIIIKALNMI